MNTERIYGNVQVSVIPPDQGFVPLNPRKLCDDDDEDAAEETYGSPPSTLGKRLRRKLDAICGQ